jgi:hypothetical protein
MEAKEKAQELVDKYRTTIRKADVYGNLASEDEIYLAKECALIAIDLPLEEYEDDLDSRKAYKRCGYLLEVKEEIKDL